MDKLTKLLYLEKLVEIMLEDYIVLNEKFEVIDYNKKNGSNVLNEFKINLNENFLLAILDKTEEDITYMLKDKDSLMKNEVDKELTCHLKLRNNFKYCLKITPLINNGQVIYIVLALKEPEGSKIEISNLEQTERLASLGAISAGIVHDLKTPILASQTFIYNLKTLINEYMESLDNEDVTKDDYKEIANEMQNIVNGVENTLEKVANIVNSVRNFTRNLSGYNEVLFSVKSIINDIKNMIGYKLRHENIDLVYTSDEDIHIIGDQGKLSQVLTNFIINSIQAYDGKGGKIEIGAQVLDNRICIMVKDFGKGISQNIQDKLFKEIITTKGAEGTGLGMFISNQIIKENFCGEVLIDSVEGVGTSISVYIPQSK